MRAAVLFLDVDYQPLRIETWQRALCDFFLDKVEVVEYSRDRKIQGVGREHPLPTVVRVLRRFRRDKIRIRFSRLNIYARDRFACQFCGARRPTEDLTFDHVVPRSRGGKTTWENIVTACVPCNKAMADRTPAEAGMALLSVPRKPRHLPAVTVRGMGGSDIPEEWRPYWSSALDP